jgi:tRNA-specific 2-thiouridylase
LYVTGIVPETNTLVLGPAEDLMVSQLVLEQENWLCTEDELNVEDLHVQVRYRGAAIPCTVHRNPEGTRIALQMPTIAPAPGQSMVVYRGDRVMGGGVLRTIAQ